MCKRCWLERLAGVRLSGVILTPQSAQRFERIRNQSASLMF